MNAKKRFASSTDVARLAGVSQSAVSRTYTVGASISEATRQKVLAAAAALKYRPSLIPRIMLTERSNLVAVVIGGMYNPFYADVLEKFTVGLQEKGIQVLLVHADSGHSFDSVIPRLVSYRIDGVISALSILSNEAADEMARLQIPVITFNTHVQNEWVTSVCCDNVSAGEEIADLFITRGARSFAFLSGPGDSPASQERLQGFRSRVGQCGHCEPTLAEGDFSYESGFSAAAALLPGTGFPAGLFCANDLMAIGALDAARQLGISVPGQLLIAGFDDIPAARWAGYNLTTFVQDSSMMTLRALENLQNSLRPVHQPNGGPITIPARLVERGTTSSLGQFNSFS